MTDPFVEIIGKAEEGNVMTMLACTDLGSDFSQLISLFFCTKSTIFTTCFKADKDLENYNRCVEASEHPKFRHLFFSS